MLSQDLNLPLEEKTQRPSWFSKKLFPVQEAISVVVKQFNVYEIFAGFVLIVTAIGELSEKELSWSWYVIVILLLAEALYLRTFKKEDLKK